MYLPRDTGANQRRDAPGEVLQATSDSNSAGLQAGVVQDELAQVNSVARAVVRGCRRAGRRNRPASARGNGHHHLIRRNQAVADGEAYSVQKVIAMGLGEHLHASRSRTRRQLRQPCLPPRMEVCFGVLDEAATQRCLNPLDSPAIAMVADGFSPDAGAGAHDAPIAQRLCGPQPA